MFSFSNNSTFGTPSAAVKPFGAATTTANTSFGAPQGFGFGTSAVSTAPAFGGFGTPAPAATSTATGFSFSTPATSQPAGLGTFGQPTAPATGFGATPAPSFGGFGTGLGFGQASTPATTSAFSFSSPSFGATTAATAPAFGGFGSTFSKPAATAAPTGFGSFGQPLMQQPFQQQQQPQALNPEEAFSQSIFNVSIFDDERDTVIAKWNYLQAMWGSGKSFYAKNTPPVEITPQNFLCRFKAIGYNKMPGKDNKAGLVLLVVNKSETDVKNQKDQLVAQLNQIFGNRPNIIVNVDSIEARSEAKSQVTIFVQEKSQISNEVKRYASTEVGNFLNQPMQKSQLTGAGIEDIVALIAPDEDQLKEYLEKPPKGIDVRMWNQAKQDNPDPKKFIPVPIIGFDELKRRIKCQERETEIHSMYLAKVQRDLEELKQKHIDATAKILSHKRKLADLSHIILNIIVKQEITRKVGVALSPEEEMLRSKLENMQALVSAPTQYKGRLSELLSQMRMQRNQWNLANTVDYALDPDSADEMKTVLSMHQKAMSVLIETANKDMEILNNIYSKMTEIVRE